MSGIKKAILKFSAPSLAVPSGDSTAVLQAVSASSVAPITPASRTPVRSTVILDLLLQIGGHCAGRRGRCGREKQDCLRPLVGLRDDFPHLVVISSAEASASWSQVYC